MIGIRLSQENFEYDIYSLIKAFYPGEEVTRTYDESALFVIDVEYGTGSITISMKKQDRVVRKEQADLQNLDMMGNRKEVKSRLKIALYEILRQESGRELPWGTLTGIRPTKIAYGLLEDGMDGTEACHFMKKEYLATDEKIQLSIEIAQREREILKNIDYRNGYSIYIGIPFCPTRCLYCSFTSFPLKVWEKRVDEYVDALCKEIEAVSAIMKEKTLNTVYMGGGTPTTLTPGQMDRVLTKLEECFDFTYNQEFTIEAGRPDSITREKLEVIKAHGISRISVNPQTMKQETLELIGRQHTVEQTREAFELARDCGFTNINMDLITGLPGETREDMEHTMKELAKLKPDSITVHSLALKRASRLNERKEQYAEYASINDNEIASMVEREARSMGLVPYYLYRQKNMTGNLENVGYAALDKAGIYNILIMEEKQSIIAMGAGASTKLVYPGGERIERVENVKSVELYIERIDEMIARKQLEIPKSW